MNLSTLDFSNRRSNRSHRLIILISIFLIIFFFSTYSSFTPERSDFVRQKWEDFSKPWTSNTAATKVEEDWIKKYAINGSDGNLYPPSFSPEQNNNLSPRVKAGFIVLVRNNELDGMKSAMYDVEAKFNRKFGYPWIFLNNEPFSEEFIKGVRSMTRSEIRFGLVPEKHWSYPSYIDQNKASEDRQRMGREGVVYGDSESYRHMCRYQSGFFFHHPQTLDLDYYWRVEPGTKLLCDIDYDPFLFMQMNNKTYGFTISLHEFQNTVETLYSTTRKFVQENPQYLSNKAAMHFLTSEPEKGINANWNLCHFWSNFEIGDLRFWRGKAYTDYFNYLDKAGGFFYERWGDAPVHSIAAVLFQDADKIHQFDDIGYFHHPWTHCPPNPKYHEKGRCSCDPGGNVDLYNESCMRDWWKGKEKQPTTIVPRTLQ